MPYINIKFGTNLNAEQRVKIQERTTILMDEVMGKRREVTAVQIQECQPMQWAVNSEALNTGDPIATYVDIKVTKGTNTPAEKSEMIYQMVKMLQKVVGTTQEACYVVIDEIPSDSWGYNGKTQAARAANSPTALSLSCK